MDKPTLTSPTIQTSKWRKARGGGKAPYQGKFTPGNPDKYKGAVDNIIFRSGMELRLFKYLDSHPSILSWSSEETVIPYVSPKDDKVHKYFVDAMIVTLGKDGNKHCYLIEVKPSYQIVPPTKPKKPNRKNTARYLKEMMTFKINSSKWTAATALCKKKGWSFIKLTEQDLVY